MGKYDKHVSFSVDDNLDKSEEVSSVQKKGRRTFRKLVGDFFDSAFFEIGVILEILRTPLLIFGVTFIALILWYVWVCSLDGVSFAKDNFDSAESFDLYYNNTKISITLQKSDLSSYPEDN